MTSIQFHRDNHFVPCVYLKGWAGPDGKIATYRVLVPHEKFRLGVDILQVRSLTTHTSIHKRLPA